MESQSAPVESQSAPAESQSASVESQSAPMESLQALWTEHTWVSVVVILLGAALVALLLDRLLGVLIRRVTRGTKTDLDDRFVEALHGPVVKSVLLVGLGLAACELELGPVIEARTLHGLSTIGLLVWMGFGFRASSLFAELASGRRDRFMAVEPTTRPLFENLGKLLVFGVGTYGLVLVWGEGATGWIASAGILGIGISLAAQDTLANLFAGVFLIMDQPYRIGDMINLESGDRGKVLKIGLRSTRLLTRDEIEVTVPNSVMGASRIVNESTGPTRRRLKVPFGVAYGSEVAQVKRVVLEAVEGLDNVLPDPEPRVRFAAMGDSALQFEMQFWMADPELRGRARDAVNTAIYEALNAASIKIPFPQRDIHIRSQPS